MKKLFLLGLLSISSLEYASDNKSSLLDEVASANAAAGGASNQRVDERAVQMVLDLFTRAVDRHSRPFITSILTNFTYIVNFDEVVEASGGMITCGPLVHDPTCAPVIDFAKILDPREDFVAFISAMKAATYNSSLILDSESDQGPKRYSLLDKVKIEQARLLAPNSIGKFIKFYREKVQYAASQVGTIVADRIHANYETKIKIYRSQIGKLKSEIAKLKEQVREKSERELRLREFSNTEQPLSANEANAIIIDLKNCLKLLAEQATLSKALQLRTLVDSCENLQNGESVFVISDAKLREIRFLLASKELQASFSANVSSSNLTGEQLKSMPGGGAAK